MPTLRTWVTGQIGELQTVERQRNYLRNPLQPGGGVCAVCRSSAGEHFLRCYQCEQHHMAAGSGLADVVAPIAYAIKRDQHAHALAVYKAIPPSGLAMRNLSSLAIMYIAYHWDCLAHAIGGSFTHVISVPSTRARPGLHPIDSVVTRRIGLPALTASVNPVYPASDRSFHSDRFRVPVEALRGARVLVIDDTWTTGSRIQSLACALKAGGAVGVAAVVLGRHVNPDFGPSKPLVDRLRQAPWFALEQCVLGTQGHV